MNTYRKKPVVIEATQWFKNGDHPSDYVTPVEDPIAGVTWSVEHKRANQWEGEVVRYFRHPNVDGGSSCRHCAKTMHFHGWIDTLEGGHIVCPGDFIITGVKGELYPCKPDIFAATYEEVIVEKRDEGRIKTITSFVDAIFEIEKGSAFDIPKGSNISDDEGRFLLRKASNAGYRIDDDLGSSSLRFKMLLKAQDA